mgnify:CR=1 FL=1
MRASLILTLSCGQVAGSVWSAEVDSRVRQIASDRDRLRLPTSLEPGRRFWPARPRTLGAGRTEVMHC